MIDWPKFGLHALFLAGARRTCRRRPELELPRFGALKVPTALQPATFSTISRIQWCLKPRALFLSTTTEARASGFG